MRCRLGGLKELLPSSSPVRGGQRPVAEREDRKDGDDRVENDLPPGLPVLQERPGRRHGEREPVHFLRHLHKASTLRHRASNREHALKNGVSCR